MRMVRALVAMAVVIALATAAGAEDWSKYDWSQEEIVLGAKDRTTDQSLAIAQAAVANSQMQISMSAVGFDISSGSTAEKYLQEVAAAGGGNYYRAEAGGQLAQVMDLAATGQAGPQPTQGGLALTQPRDGDVAGPNIELVGTAPPGQVLVVYTVVYDAGTAAKLRTVPGSRHRVAADGNFTVRVATPRISFGAVVGQLPKLRYELHAHMLDAAGVAGPEVVVNLLSPTP